MLVGPAAFGVEDAGDALELAERRLELVMAAAAALGLLGDFDPGFFVALLAWFGDGVVEMADAALGYHGLDLAVQGVGEHVAELHFEARGVADDGAGEEDLVGGAEVEG